MASDPKMECQVFLCIFQKNSAMTTLGLKEMIKFIWEGRGKSLPYWLSQFSFSKKNAKIVNIGFVLLIQFFQKELIFRKFISFWNRKMVLKIQVHPFLLLLHSFVSFSFFKISFKPRHFLAKITTILDLFMSSGIFVHGTYWQNYVIFYASFSIFGSFKHP